MTRLAGAKANELRYDHERGSFRAEYEPSASRRSTSTEGHEDGSLPSIECEIRCDIDTWGASLDIVVDPPPQTITCLRRHRLSAEGGGLWLTLTHDSIFVDDERLLALVRRAPGKEKGLVMVNGAKVAVDVEELSEHEIKALTRQKRVKPPRIPLDQPPVMGVIRRRKAEWSSAEGEGDSTTAPPPLNGSGSSWASGPRISSPLSRFFTYAMDQATTTTQQAVAAISPASIATASSTLDPTKLPMQYALEALAWTQEFNSKPQSQDGWTVVSDKGVVVHRKLMPEVSPFIPVHKGFKVIEGVSAEELASVIMESDCRKTWDERYDSSQVLESYGGQARTTFHVAKGGFPFRDRGFYLANVMARAHMSPPLSRRTTAEVADQSPTARNTIFCVSASFSPESAKSFTAAKYNPYTLPIGRVYVDAWILETLDPYTKENYAIPSTRCTRLVAVDYAGSIPAAINWTINATLARGVLAVDSYMKNNVKASLPITRLPTPGLIVNEKRPEDRHGAASSSVGSPSLVEGERGMSSLVTAPFMAWKLRKRDENRVLVEAKFDIEKRVYKSSMVVRLPPRSSAGRREASNATIIGSADDEGHSPPMPSSTTPTPRPSRLALSPSPHGRRREASDQSLPESLQSTTTDNTIKPNPTSPSQSQFQNPPPPTPAMPGSMVMTPGLPSNTGFPSDSQSTITGLPTALESSSEVSGLPNSHPRARHTMSVSPPPRHRQRAATSAEEVGQHNQSLHHSQSQSQISATYHDSATPSGIRGRTISSVFTTKGEVRPPTDLVVMEVVVDSKMFNGTGYMVDVRARRRKGVVEKLKEQVDEKSGLMAVPLESAETLLKSLGAKLEVPPPSADSAASSSEVPTPVPTRTPSLSSNVFRPETLDLPLAYTIHTMPSSPLHSSGLSSEPPSRHLLRLTLPTAQYKVNSVWDPLAGQMRSAPVKPEWMKVLEEEEEDGGWVVDVVVRPVEGKMTPVDGPGAGETGKKDGGKTKDKKKKQSVLINGKEVVVVGEKESLTSLGREELLDDRVGRMGVLSR